MNRMIDWSFNHSGYVIIIIIQPIRWIIIMWREYFRVQKCFRLDPPTWRIIMSLLSKICIQPRLACGNIWITHCAVIYVPICNPVNCVICHEHLENTVSISCGSYIYTKSNCQSFQCTVSELVCCNGLISSNLSNLPFY